MASLAKSLFLIFYAVSTLTMASSAFAQATTVGSAPAGPLYSFYMTQAAESYIDSLKSMPTDEITSLDPEQQAICEKRYAGILKDGIIDIKIAMGYFDWSLPDPAPILLGDKNYGWSPSIDLGIFASFRDFLVTPCEGTLQFCGFHQESKSSPYFTKYVTIRGQRYLARIEMRNASISEYLINNTQTNLAAQQAQSAAMDKFFADSFANSDVLIYFGHSRNGGGPDFNYPRILPNGHLDYANYYKRVRPGFTKMAVDLKASKTPPAIFALMSCDSRDHFFDSIRTLAPSMGVISSTAILNIKETFTATAGTIDAVLRGQCQRSFYQEIRMDSSNQKFITMDGVFK